jgi:CheY-like chemotaxis protein/two-component sensor histidine kinase
LSHDFNNILTAVSGSAEMLRTETDPVERGELLDEIIAARDRGAALTRQLLSFARREVTQPRVIDIGEHARSLTRLLQRVAGDRQRLRFELASDCRALVDPGQLEQALVNLVANARDAMPDGGWCEIACERVTNAAGDARVLLHVSDDGTGMPPEIAERAFEPFFTTKARGQGTGLGLASVHGMAQQSNGSARIDTAPGRGTRVTIDLPAVSEAATAPPDATTASAHHSGPYSILVAEDDIGTRRIVERILRHAGYDVRTAVDGIEALAVLEAGEGPFDLLLSDVMMPGCTGPELSDRARVMHPALPVLLMTGYAEEQLGELMSSRTARDVITKPFSGTELTNRIAELLRATSPV